MLMEGSYKKQLDDILVAFRRADRTQVEREPAGQAEGGGEGGAGVGVGMMRDIDKTQYGEILQRACVWELHVFFFTIYIYIFLCFAFYFPSSADMCAKDNTAYT